MKTKVISARVEPKEYINVYNYCISKDIEIKDYVRNAYVQIKSLEDEKEKANETIKAKDNELLNISKEKDDVLKAFNSLKDDFNKKNKELSNLGAKDEKIKSLEKELKRIKAEASKSINEGQKSLKDLQNRLSFANSTLERFKEFNSNLVMANFKDLPKQF